jgi:hypothetical protein
MYMESLIKKVNEDSQKGKKYDFEDETQGE